MGRLVVIISLLFLVSGCSKMKLNIGWARPASMANMETPPDGPPMYQQGYLDGCSSGFSGYANSFNKIFWDWKQDPELAQNPVYYQIWKDAYAYCAVRGMMAEEHDFGNWR